MNTRVLVTHDVSYVALSTDSIGRHAPRHPSDMQANYLERFDDATLFSDIFIVNDGIELVSPPYLNLASELQSSVFLLEGRDVSRFVTWTERDRGAFATIAVAARSGNTFEVRGGLGPYETAVQPSGASLLREKRVLVTHQKDNDLDWIAYWVLHHVVLHGFNSVLIYDNLSERYTIEDIRLVLSCIPGLDCAVIVNWPTPFGVTGGPNGKWDSDYGQHVYLRHSYSRYLTQAEAAFICDIDELYVDATVGRSIIDRLHSVGEPILSIPRRQIVQVVADGFHGDTGRVHGVYAKRVTGADYLAGKYIYAPSRLASYPGAWLKVHHPTGVPIHQGDPSEGHIRHFGGIRIDWRTDWSRRISNARSWPLPLETDEPLVRDTDRLRDSWRVVANRLIDLGREAH